MANEIQGQQDVLSIPVAGTPKPSNSTINTEVPRIDGRYKTTGTAKYTSDYNLPGMVYAVPVCSTIANGSIDAIDTNKASAMRGVIRLYTRENLPKIYRANATAGSRLDEHRPPLSDDKIDYAGQYVALVVARTLDQARDAADAVVVRCKEDKANATRDLAEGMVEEKLRQGNKRGETGPAFEVAAVKVDETYETPIEVHNPIELHASVAQWTGQKYVLYETTQSIFAQRDLLAQMLGVPKEQVQVIMRYLGSGFGGKLWPWPHSVLAAAASRDLNLPVKLVVDRHMMFKTVGHRPQTTQRMRIGATLDGKLTSLQHDYTSDTSILSDLAENCGMATPVMYTTPNLMVRSSIVKRNVGSPTAMRCPGTVPGIYALESAMDELAIKLKMDPVQLRLINEPPNDPSNNRPFTSRHLVECMKLGAEKFGWSKRNPEVGSMRKGDLILGWGMAACSYRSNRGNCKATVHLNDDGKATVLCGTQDIGTGTYTIFAQIVHAKTGVPIDHVDVQLGDTDQPEGPHSGGSWVTGTVLPAIDKACEAAIQSLLGIAVQTPSSPFHGAVSNELAFTNGVVHRKAESESSGVAFADLLKRAGLRAISGDGESAGSFQDRNAQAYSSHSFGAQFVEVEWDPGIARLRVSRVVSVLDVGRVINLKTARNQVEGAIVMGIGMALFEEAIYDQRTGHPLNANLADYIVTTNADCPIIDAIFTDFPDPIANTYGARGCGEISLAGLAPAITAAVYHATGVRVRKLPVRIEDLLTADAHSLTA